jgi:hypothetical protein
MFKLQNKIFLYIKIIMAEIDKSKIIEYYNKILDIKKKRNRNIE